MSEVKANAAKCEMCAGRLILKDENSFECESCGVSYPKDWVKAKIQEITGTVKIDGTVKVEIDGGGADQMIKAAEDLIRIGDWSEANKRFRNVTTEHPGDYRGWFGIAKVATLNFTEIYDPNGAAFRDLKENVDKALMFASGQDKAMLQNRWDSFQALCEEGAEKIKSEQERLAPGYTRLKQTADELRKELNGITAEITARQSELNEIKEDGEKLTQTILKSMNMMKKENLADYHRRQDEAVKFVKELQYDPKTDVYKMGTTVYKHNAKGKLTKSGKTRSNGALITGLVFLAAGIFFFAILPLAILCGIIGLICIVCAFPRDSFPQWAPKVKRRHVLYDELAPLLRQKEDLEKQLQVCQGNMDDHNTKIESFTNSVWKHSSPLNTTG